ncbi:thioesterase II family protein [Haloechinothrix halophila]|uniref:thioesterase II family protein n=1 Tax=Haloechinothrix halophila TaxID=1069073 RepID=UPI00146FB0EA|nr:alpha/beta fold hydrolase [Haloechinothrix halophila]
MFMFPHAGGRAERFLEWQPELDGTVRLVGVCPPGAGHRFAEERPRTVVELADAAATELAEAAEGEFYLFGHSLGALVAFEVARRLPVRPAALVVSGCAGPRLLPSERVVRLASLPPDSFLEEAQFFGGVPSDSLQFPEMAEVLVERLRQEFRMVAGYVFEPEPVLNIPIVTVVGESDPHVTGTKASCWQEVTAHPIESHVVPGGHFYFEENDEIIAILRRLVLATSDGQRGEDSSTGIHVWSI